VFGRWAVRDTGWELKCGAGRVTVGFVVESWGLWGSVAAFGAM